MVVFQRIGGITASFFFTDPATTELYTLSLHDALPISRSWPARTPATCPRSAAAWSRWTPGSWTRSCAPPSSRRRSEEHTSELQSQSNLVCRLLLEKKKIVPYTFVYSSLMIIFSMRECV